MKRPDRSTLPSPAAPAAVPATLEPLLDELLAAAGGGDHPAASALVAYHAGELPASDEAALQDHLAACAACSALLLDLAELGAAAAPREPSPPADLATATAWRALAPRLAGEGTAGGPPPGEHAAGELPTGGRRRVPAWAAAAAAALLVAVPLSILLVRGQRHAGELRRTLTTPQTAVPVLYLDSLTRDGGPEAAAIELPAGDGFFLVAVTPRAPAAEGGYRVEVLDERGRQVWREDGVRPSDHGALRLGFTRRSLPPGSYRLVATPADGAGEPIEFPFTLRDSS